VIGCMQFIMGSCGAALAGYILPGTVRGMLGTMAAFGFAGIAVLAWLEIIHANRVPLKCPRENAQNSESATL